MVGVESDDGEELELVQQYDLDEDDDEEDFASNLPNDASLATDFGKREFKFTKVLTINKNGSKTFTKYRQSTKVGGSATTTTSGNFNTSLDVATSASGKFDANTTYVSKGQRQKIVASGTVVSSSSSKSNIEKRRLWQEASADTSVTLQIPAVLHIDNSVRSGSETLKLPFRSFLTLFSAQVNTTAEKLLKMKTTVGGQVISRVAFANKTVSLTKSCMKAYTKSKSVSTNPSVDDERFNGSDDNNAAVTSNLYQISFIRSKSHTWTKVVSQSKTEVVVDVLTCTKTRLYGKSFKKGAFVVFTGSGQVSWEKSRITIVAQRLQKLSPHEYGVHFIKSQFGDGSILQFLGSSFDTTM